MELKRKHSFKYKPEFTETFKTDILDGQIIPLAIETFERLKWVVVYKDNKSVEAKRKDDFGNMTEKITVTKLNSGHIKLQSKSLKRNMWDFGVNSLRTGNYRLLFQKLATDYKASGKLAELEKDYIKETSWADYEIPTELPKPKQTAKPNLAIVYIGGLLTAIGIGLLAGFLTQKFIYIVFLFEVGIGFLFGYLFSKILGKAHFTDFKIARILTAVFIFVIFITNQYFQFHLILIENNIPNLGFIEFQKYLLEEGFTVNRTNVGWIGLVVVWILQLAIPYFVAQIKILNGILTYSIEKIPEKVIEYTIYLFEKDKTESEVRAELALKGWNKKSDQDDVFEAVGAIAGFNQSMRE